ncbi:protein kinase [candidate division KSB1 bacterium]|nr:protein kinase [candidate division KSB1 bacterium]
MIGKTISHYKILEKLGEGGMGIVYKAQDTKLDRVVALKFLPSHLTANDTDKARFIQEAKAAAALQHHNICTIHEIDETKDGQLFICMDLYEGETLKQKIEKGPLHIEEAIDIALQIAEGLSHAHQKDIVHRDIKPANIFIASDGVVKIVDFGLAKLRGLTKLTMAGTTLGTAAYMSPEQAKGNAVDPRTDIWAFGVVLYEMVTGQCPFRGDYEQAVIYSIMNDEPEPVTGIRTGVPMELERIVTKSLGKKQGERYQHIDEMYVDLNLLENSLKAGETKTVVHEKAKSHSKRVYAYGTLFLILLVLIILKSVIFPVSADRTTVIDSIAVLPLDNLSGDPKQEYFSDGMTEAVIAELAKIRALKVISRTSVMRYKNTDKSLPEIADELNVDAIIEGSILRAGDRVRITTQLIDGRSDRHLWAKSYERDLQDVLKLQSEVAQDIASEIQISLSEQEKATFAEAQSIDPGAHETYLRGLYHWNKRTEEDLKRGIDYFEQAIEKEPKYAAAYAAISQSYIVLTAWGFSSHTESHEKARIMAEKALEINNRLAEAHTALGAVNEGEWNWKEAEKEYKRAIELNPNYATGHQWYAEFLTILGVHEKACAEMKKALELDPLSLIINHNFAITLFLARDYDRALEQLQITNELEISFGATLYYTYLTYIEKGMYPKAVKTYQEILSQNEGTAHLAKLVGETFERGGIEGFYQWIIDHIEDVSIQPDLIPVTLSTSYAKLGKIDEAFKWLEVLYEKRYPRLRYIKVMQPFDTIRSDPRYTDLLRRMNLEN